MGHFLSSAKIKLLRVDSLSKERMRFSYNIQEVRLIMKKTTLIAVLAIVTMIFGTSTISAEKAKPVAQVLSGSYGLSWNPQVPFGKFNVRISAPSGEVLDKVFEAGAIPGFDLSDLKKGALDGTYTYEITLSPNLPMKNIQRDPVGVTPKSDVTMTQTGYFTVKNGSIVNPHLQEGGATPVKTSGTQGEDLSSTQDQVINDDLIVTFSVCIGNDCVNGESFGFDTLRLKENNLRIKAQDTSNSASFPTRDWQITFNGSNNGDAEYFAIDDVDGGRTPFKIEASAPTNSLYVDDGGRIGLGTSTPVVEIHVKDGNTPTLRLEQDGTSGFTPQTWDVAGNEANFFIRDATNGSKLPLKIKPGAPTSTIFMKADGKIGFGTESPGFPLHLLTSSTTNASMVLERSGNAQGFMNATNTAVNFGSANGYDVNVFSTAIRATFSGTDNSLVMASGAQCTDAGVWQDASSRELKKNIKARVKSLVLKPKAAKSVGETTRIKVCSFAVTTNPIYSAKRQPAG